MSIDVDLPVSADGLLAEFGAVQEIGWSAIHLARTLSWLSGESREQVLLGAALCLQAQQAGSVCLPLDEPRTTDLPWPEPNAWLSQLSDSVLVGCGEQAPANQRPLRLVGRQLYLERNWQAEEAVRLALLDRLTLAPPAANPAALEEAIERAFSAVSADPAATTGQRAAVRTAATSWTSVIAGGPGTGKTTTIAQLLRVLDDLASSRTSVALASFTGKAAARMQQSLDASLASSGQTAQPWRWLQVSAASTLHSLLGARPNGNFGRDANNPLPHDLLVIDEMSMVSLDLMAALMAALRPATRLVLVGDPHQLSSVDAGAVLADIVTAGLPAGGGQPGSAITVLEHSHRFSGPIQQLAEAIRDARPEAALDLLATGPTGLEWVATDPDPVELAGLGELSADIVAQGQAIVNAAQAGRSTEALHALDAHRLLCAHRRGRYGVASWSRFAEQELRRAITGYGRAGEWYLGRPVLIGRNAADLQISNGDTGVAVNIDGRIQVALSSGDEPRLRSPWLLDAAETMHAMTVHKSQGSEYQAVTLVLPSTDSPLLTRELLYTAVTRARQQVRIIGTAEAITTAIATPARRATGLGSRL